MTSELKALQIINMSKENQSSARPARTGAKHKGVVVLAAFNADLTSHAFATEVSENIIPTVMREYGEFLFRDKILSKPEVKNLWRDDGEVHTLWRAVTKENTRKAALVLGDLAGRLTIEAFNQTEGVQITRQAAVRAQELLDRMEKKRPVLTKKELREINDKFLDDAPGTLENLRAALEKRASESSEQQTRAGRVNASREDLVLLSSLIACLAGSLATPVLQKIAYQDVVDRLKDVLGQSGLTSHAELERAWDEGGEEIRRYRNACSASICKAASQQGDLLGMIVIDILSRTDGVALTKAGVARILELQDRAEKGEGLVTKDENLEVEKTTLYGMPKNRDELVEVLRKLAGPETMH